MTSKRIKKLKAGVFIDDSNLFWGMKEVGWRLDYDRLKKYLKKRYSPLFYNFYCCEDIDPSNEKFLEKAKKQKGLRDILSGLGYNLVVKPLKYIKDKHTGQIITKGDVDVDITVAVQNSLNDIENIILFSGDSDYLKLVEDCFNKGKSIRIYSFGDMLSWELKQFAFTHPRCNYKLLDELKNELEFISDKNIQNVQGKLLPVPPIDRNIGQGL